MRPTGADRVRLDAEWDALVDALFALDEENPYLAQMIEDDVDDGFKAAGGPGSGNFGHAGGEGGPGNPGGSRAERPGQAKLEEAIKVGIEEAASRPITFYHGTIDEALISIKKKGLVPKAGKGADAWAHDRAHHIPPAEMFIGERAASVYLATTPEEAEYFAKFATEMNPGTKALILRVDVPTGETSRIKDDEFSGEKRFVGSIPPTWIKGKVRMDYDPFSEPAIEALASKPTTLYVVILVKDDPKSLEFNPDQPRDEQGQWTSGGGAAPWVDAGGWEHTGIAWQQTTDSTTGRPIPIPCATVEEAAALILEGKVVEVPDERAAYTLIDKMAAMAADAKTKGEQAPDYDLCNVTVKGSNIFCGESLRTEKYPQGIPRIEMPQLGGEPVPGSEADHLPHNSWDPSKVDGAEAFVTYLQGIGMQTKVEQVPAAGLRASQRELVGSKVGAMMRDRSYEPGTTPIFVSSDNYVVDGHHRWAAVVGRDLEDGRLGDNPISIRRVNAPIAELLHISAQWAEKFGIKQAAGVTAQTARISPLQKSS